MPSVKFTPNFGRAVRDDICGDPSHKTGPARDIRELASRRRCEESKVFKLGADGSRYTVHASSATIRGGGEKKPVHASKELDPTSKPYVPVGTPNFELALPVLDAAARSGADRGGVGSEVVTLRTPDQPYFFPPTIKARFATTVGIEDTTETEYQTTRGVFKPSATAGIERNTRGRALPSCFSPTLPPRDYVTCDKISSQATPKFFVPNLAPSEVLKAAPIKAVDARDRMARSRMTLLSRASKKEKSEDEWVDVGMEAAEEEVEEERWVVV